MSTTAAPAPDAGKKENKRNALAQELLIPVLAVLTGLIVGAIVIVASGENPFVAYGALFAGSFGTPADYIAGFQSYFATGDTEALLKAIYPFTESLVTATPYIFAGLSVALGFRCGLFNIGAEGQFFIGALASAFVGYSLKGLPMIIHLPLAILGGALGGAIWGMIPGYLKARFGAHEVVNTIMMNWIAFRLSDWLLSGPMQSSGFRPVTPNIEASAELPRFFASPLRFNLGFFIALLVAYLVYWLLFKTTIGFEIRSVGANPDAAKYAGMNIIRNFVLVMFLAGGLAGLAGASQVLGVDHWVGQGFSAGYGFDAIALALLGRSHPAGVVLAALLFGFLRSGATDMQSMAGIPIDIISIIQGMVIVFIAAPDIIRWLYRIRSLKVEGTVLTRGWGK
ncbi:MAG: ABC transporter permease [Anaerolineales bacterium]|uniref:ABC transporter permease n=1 Tax=Candidatus Villigracilis vicinus TaxID=3140679 RepID=UPI0031353B20|nr:ABC transporter permease [Anaerolineales bacterium]MBK7449310.1 ABC transporter permease [Anaerolineales bacterium]MBK9779773.1 ABC transporter permease [Anaerolineales bacterium]